MDNQLISFLIPGLLLAYSFKDADIHSEWGPFRFLISATDSPLKILATGYATMWLLAMGLGNI